MVTGGGGSQNFEIKLLQTEVGPYKQALFDCPPHCLPAYVKCPP